MYLATPWGVLTLSLGTAILVYEKIENEYKNRGNANELLIRCQSFLNYCFLVKIFSFLATLSKPMSTCNPVSQAMCLLG